MKYFKTKGFFFENIAIVIVLIVFTVCKIPHLWLPHYWDEGWSYAVAVQKMAEAGPSLLSGHIDIALTRGHPLFYYATAATWLNFIGDSLLTRHLFALGISLAFLLAIFSGVRKLFNFNVAILSTLLVGTQIIFFVQSSMLLPEVLVAFLAYLSIFYFAIRNYIGLGIALTLLLQTKESGLVMWLILLIVFLVLFFSYSKKYNLIKLFIALFIPVLLLCAFFIYQKIKFGWFFFPEHMGLIEKSPDIVLYKLKTILKLVFREEKRKWFWGMAILISILSLYLHIKRGKKRKDLLPQYDQSVFIIVAITFILLYSIFCALNFYSARYLIAAIVPSIILLAYLLDKSITSIDRRIYIPSLLIMTALSFQNFLRNDEIGDIGMKSYKALEMQRAAINYLLKHADPDTPIAVGGFLQRTNLTEPACGFLGNHPPFTEAKWEITEQSKFILFDNMDQDNRLSEIEKNPAYQLVYHFYQNDLDAKIFEKK